jgi:2-keto-4-pentenoate hydratase/2-oxohepta-3-ene-1,7-dioic acid hydratase in catechol pathway
MILVRFSYKKLCGWGVLSDGTVHALEGTPFAAPRAGRPIADLDQVRLLPPVTPTKIVAVGRNYVEHAAEFGNPPPPEPLLFLKPPSAIIGPGEAIVLPKRSDRVDHEAELAVVIGRRCRRVRREEALDYVLGYICANDVTARDLQKRDGQWARAKGFDTFCPLGPWIVTDLDPTDLEVTARVNGEIRQHGYTRDFIFSLPVLIEYAAAAMTLEPGDVLLTGTPAGVGPLHVGDTVEVEISGIGGLKNPVVAA